MLSDFKICGASAQEPGAEMSRLELPLSDGSQIHAGSDIAFASADGRGQSGSLLLGQAGQDISNVAFAQPNAPAGAPQQPSYRAGGEAEQVPSPTYLDPGNEQLSVAQQLERLTQRMNEYETASRARDDATRTIIRDSFAERGSSINDYVIFGGVLESLVFWQEDFDGVSESDIVLDTAELDFEIQMSNWALGSFVVEYFDGNDFFLQSTEDDEVAIDRLTVRQAWVMVGDLSNYPLFALIGRDVVPFGISTGDPITDVLTINDPLTVEVFETREDFVLFGYAGPVCCSPPAGKPVPAPPVRPLIFNPIARRVATAVVPYCPCTPPTKPAQPTWPPCTCTVPFTAGVYFFNGDTIDGPLEEDHIQHMGGTMGYLHRGSFGCIPWSVDMDVDVTSSVFDSNFLQYEYRRFLPEIGYVPGMAAHIKTMIGPTSFIAEWNGALTDAEFVDDAAVAQSIRPQAWQVAFAYQFDWNPSVEFIGAQGTYFVMGYSETEGLAGVTKAVGDPLAPTLLRVGNAPEKRLSVGVGEWVLPGLRVAVEYSHNIDYDVAAGGTGNSADGVFFQTTYEW
jgi:hypothetical protein